LSRVIILVFQVKRTIYCGLWLPDNISCYLSNMVSELDWGFACRNFRALVQACCLSAGSFGATQIDPCGSTTPSSRGRPPYVSHGRPPDGFLGRSSYRSRPPSITLLTAAVQAFAPSCCLPQLGASAVGLCC
jgi:hypothetical protein